MKTNQESGQVLEKNFSTTDHLQALNQLIEKCNEYNLPLCLGFFDYEKAFDSVEHAAIVQALWKVNINENYVTMIENIYKGATARIHIDNRISEAFEIQRGVRQGDPISPKLFIAIIEQVFKEAGLKYGINIDGEYLRDLRFADDVACLMYRERRRNGGTPR
ncbi:endonuclease-reverse transcriptase [Plakobranchus ocellatus]|uniref:Endonuclease-reverse transcriptase n=1 Tax=Plakobranchus ocellatus TaxID=259542 RepID=A0AAV3Y614_9GAST|nr:endonuclease-reverse transcriptase [Plakobranchus ocellatus]